VRDLVPLSRGPVAITPPWGGSQRDSRPGRAESEAVMGRALVEPQERLKMRSAPDGLMTGPVLVTFGRNGEAAGADSSASPRSSPRFWNHDSSGMLWAGRVS